jgi:hypothetical protein
MMIVSSDYVPCLSLFKNQRHPTMLAWNSYRTHILMVELAAWRIRAFGLSILKTNEP